MQQSRGIRVVIGEYCNVADKVGCLYKLAERVVFFVFGSSIRQSSTGHFVQMVIGEFGNSLISVVYIPSLGIFFDIVPYFGQITVLIVFILVAGVGRRVVVIWVVNIGQDNSGEPTSRIVIEPARTPSLVGFGTLTAEPVITHVSIGFIRKDSVC